MFSHSQTSNANGHAVILGLTVTVAMFVALPLANYLSLKKESVRWASAPVDSLRPPPPPPEELPLPPRSRDEVKQPELHERPPPLTLSAIDAILNPGTGSASGDFGMVQTLETFDVLAEIAVFDLTELDKHPLPIQRIAPTYPYEAKQSGISGWVKVFFIVDETGSVRTPRVDASSHQEFESAALDAVRLWKFTPGVKDGRKVRTRMLLPFVFSINAST